jgi:hypothetical protein
MRTSVKFDLIPLSEVPDWLPIAKPAAYPRGSQWDEALKALLRKPKHAIKVVESDNRRRNRLKATLQTIAKNRNLSVELRTEGTAIYAWSSKKRGRYSSQTKS